MERERDASTVNAMGAIRMCGAVLYRDGRVLLGTRSRHRTFYHGVWDLPGGHCYAGEAPDWALARELQEEIGVRPVTMVLLATPDLPGTGAETAEYSVYLVTEWVGEPTNLLREEHE